MRQTGKIFLDFLQLPYKDSAFIAIMFWSIISESESFLFIFVPINRSLSLSLSLFL